MPNIIEIKQKIPAMYLTWVINNICTKRCSYCSTNLHTGTNHNYDWTHAEKFIDQMLSRYSTISLAIAGGEPTLSPWLPDLVKKFSNAGHPVGVTSNGARTARYYQELTQYLSYIILSYHPSDEEPEIIEKAYACKENTRTAVSVMFDSRHFNKSLAMYNFLAKENVVDVQPVKVSDWGTATSEGRDYTPEQIQIIDNLPYVSAKKKNSPGANRAKEIKGAEAFYDDGTHELDLKAQALINSGNTDFSGWECDIGLESLFVHFDGRIHLGNCVTAPKIGRIQDIDNIAWPTKPIICRQNYCNCSTDVYISKRKI